jgi:hypothetical protein
MSHFTKCDLKLTNLEAIKRALGDMELAYAEAAAGQGATVRGYRGQTMEAELSVDMGRYDVGVLDAGDGTFDLVSDWWGVETTKGVTEAEFKESLYRRYQYHNVKMACDAKGYEVSEEVNEEDGSVRLVVNKWVAE